MSGALRLTQASSVILLTDEDSQPTLNEELQRIHRIGGEVVSVQFQPETDKRYALFFIIYTVDFDAHQDATQIDDQPF